MKAKGGTGGREAVLGGTAKVIVEQKKRLEAKNRCGGHHGVATVSKID